MNSRKAPTKNELAQKVQRQTTDLSERVQNIETASRISQMLVQQIGNSVSQIAADIRELANRQRDLQYRLLAVQDLAGLETKDILELSEKKQISDFTDASNVENTEKGYTTGEIVNEDSVVIITTQAEKEERSILRSKLALSEISLPDFRESLMGKKAGDVFSALLSDVKHEVTLLEVLQKPEEKPEATTKEEDKKQ